MNSGDAIRKAREAYDALTNKQKALVDNYQVLEKAERQFAALTGALPFEDIQGHWAAEAIGYVYRNGLMNGVGERVFAPDGDLDRAMLVTILYRLEGEPAVGGSHSYTDVVPGSWYEKAVLWATEHHIVGGYGNGLFGPSDRITREQLATMLFRYASYKKWDTAARADLSKYADADQISVWALDALRWANGAALMTGRSETVIAPGGEASRGETAALLMRFCENVLE